MIGAGTGADRARRHATRVAQRRLDRGAEPVACPDCGWFQPDMVREVRRRASRRLETVAIGLPVLAGVVLAFMVLLETDGFQRSFSHLMANDGPVVWDLLIFMLATPALCFGVQAALRFRIDPNRTPSAGRFADGPIAIRIAAGTPSAAAADRLNGGSPHLTPLAADAPADGWMTIQLLNARWPAACAACLTPTQQTRTVNPVGQSLVRVNVPTCPACRLRDKQWMWGAGGVVTVAVAAVIVPLVATTPTAAGLVAGFGMLFLAGIAALPAMIAVDRFRRPVRFRNYAADRNTLQIRFKRPGYAERFIAANRTAARPPREQDRAAGRSQRR